MPPPPYSYGNYNNPNFGNYPTYHGAMLNQLAHEDDDLRYQYPNQVPQSRYPATGSGRGADIAGAVGTTLAPVIARNVAGAGAMAAANAGIHTAGSGVYNPVLSGPQSAGLGIATELGAHYLKPKQDVPTASPFADLTDQYRRREEGSGEGIAGGALKWGGRGAQIGQSFGPIGMGIGALAGGIGGAIGGIATKNAASAATDFTRADAEEAIRQMYRTRGGREVSQQELNQILAGQGSQPGDRWVGEMGLYSVLTSLANNFAKEGGGAPAPPAVPRGPLDQPAGATPAGAGDLLAPTRNADGTVALTGNPTVDMINARTGGVGTPGGGSRNDGVYGGTANTSLGTPQEQSQSPPGGQQSPLPGSPPVPPPAPPAPPPADTAAFTGWGKFAKDMEGFDLKRYQRDIIGKPNHPEAGAKKILVAQLASNIDPTDPNAVKTLVEQLKAKGEKVEFDNLDRIRFADAPELGWIDVLKNKQFVKTGSGPRKWHWLHNHGEGKPASTTAASTTTTGAAPTTTTPTNNTVNAAGFREDGTVASGSTIDQIMANIGRIVGDRGINTPTRARDAVIRYMQ